jgi:ATP-dependent DNA ligase
MVDFIRPMLAFRQGKETDALLDAPDRIADEKIDGVRAQVHIAGGRTVAVYSRTGKSLGNEAAWLFTLRWPIEAGEAVFDGEFYPVEADGSPVVTGEAVGKAHRLALFDCLWWMGASNMNQPFILRRGCVETVVAALADERVRATRLSASPRQLLAEVEAEGGEGILLKDMRGRYIPGSRTPLWVKYISRRRKKLYDVVICGWTRTSATGEAYKTGECGLQYGVWDARMNHGAGGVRRCGSLGVTMTAAEAEGLIGKVAVVEAWFQYPSGALRHPQFKRFRSDKLPQECLPER